MVGSGSYGKGAHTNAALLRLAAAVLVDQVSLLIERLGLKLVANSQGVVQWDVLAPHVNGLPGLKAECRTKLLDAAEQMDCLGLCQHD